MRVLARGGYTGISAADWLAWRRGERPLSRRAGFKATVFVVASEIGGRNSWDLPAGAHRLMSAADILAWLDAGMDVGAHGMTHLDLAAAPLPKVQEEVLGSHAALAELCGRPPAAFAYPYGTRNAEVAAVVAGSFPLAFGVREGRNGLHTDRADLRRTLVQSSDTRLDVLLRARLGWSPLSQLRARLRLRSRVRRLLQTARSARP